MRVSKKLTIDELSERLSLSRSTIYCWVRDLPIPGSGPGGEFAAHAQKLGSPAVSRKYRRLREEAYEEGRAAYHALVREETFRDFICLYMAEGFKRSRNVVALCNSDPAIVKLANRWICRFARNPVRYSIQYHADQDLGELVRYWGKELAVDPQAIRLQRKSNSNQLSGRQWRSRYGVLTVTAADTYFRARLQAWIDCVRESWV